MGFVHVGVCVCVRSGSHGSNGGNDDWIKILYCRMMEWWYHMQRAKMEESMNCLKTA